MGQAGTLYRRFNDHFVILFILVAAALLRFYEFTGFSLSNDELSALYRTQFDTFSSLINEGVLVDFHPAGVQVFLYYLTKCFGMSEFVVRLPFVISGVVSVYLIYKIAGDWFGYNTAIFSASAAAFLEFPILYSQIARPYSIGLMFTLWMVYFWNRIVFTRGSRISPYVYAGYIITTAISLYIHYFSFLFAAIVGISGLFLCPKKNLLRYALSGIASLILFIPHLRISIYHFSIGGLSTWLGEPGNTWMLEHILYIFNNSMLLTLIVLGIALFATIYRFRYIPMTWLSLLWFLLPMLIGFYYSRWINPVLQHSILIFSFPYLLMFLFSFISPEKKKVLQILALSMLFFGVFHTVNVKDYYGRQHFGEFRDVAARIQSSSETYGQANIEYTANANNIWYIHYYLDKYDANYDFVQDDLRGGGHKLFEFRRILKDSEADYFIHASTTAGPNEIPAMIKEYFPFLREYVDYSGLSYYVVYSRMPGVVDFQLTDPVLEEEFLLYTLGRDDESLLLDSTGSSEVFTYSLDSGLLSGVQIVRTRLECQLIDRNTEAQVVLSLHNKDEETTHWYSSRVDTQLNTGEKASFYSVFFLPDRITSGTTMRIYVSKPFPGKVFVKKLKIGFYNNRSVVTN